MASTFLMMPLPVASAPASPLTPTSTRMPTTLLLHVFVLKCRSPAPCRLRISPRIRPVLASLPPSTLARRPSDPTWPQHRFLPPWLMHSTSGPPVLARNSSCLILAPLPRAPCALSTSLTLLPHYLPVPPLDPSLHYRRCIHHSDQRSHSSAVHPTIPPPTPQQRPLALALPLPPLRALTLHPSSSSSHAVLLVVSPLRPLSPLNKPMMRDPPLYFFSFSRAPPAAPTPRRYPFYAGGAHSFLSPPTFLVRFSHPLAQSQPVPVIAEYFIRSTSTAHRTAAPTLSGARAPSSSQPEAKHAPPSRERNLLQRR
ncbi:hypothetical protein B0H13DRAFT_2331373 [Mycena leptocephala]|nr:hypothetical protein B0H13DRAFT_2331373 [Mycena leptocephala]